MRRARPQQGFTLIEVVVAFAIFALSVGVIYGLFNNAIRRHRQGEARIEQVLVAQSVLAQLRAQPGPWAATQSGQTENGSAWDLAVSPYDAVNGNADNAWRPVQVIVTVHRRTQSSSYVLKSIELMYQPKAT